MKIVKVSGSVPGKHPLKVEFRHWSLCLSAEELVYLEEILVAAARTGDLTTQAAAFLDEVQEKIIARLG